MDGITAVQARITTIEARFGTPRTVGSGPTSGGGPTFDSVLSAQLSSAVTPAEQLAPGQYGSLVPPADLAAYGNGRIPAAALAPVDAGPHRLWAPAATAFGRLLDAARAEGIDIGITDSYRDLAAQERLAVEKGLYAQGGLAATPGTSPHGWGLAVDLDLDAAAQAWMQQRAWQFGFVEDVPREPWHWTFRPAS
jgi:LAS superfamily LD-carboxypeptidase LdcB